MKKKILIVGAGYGQIPAIITAKKYDLEVIVVDKNPNAPGMKLAHYAYPVDVIDKEGVFKIARTHRIDGIMTMQSDLPVPTVGYVNDMLHLKGVNHEVAHFCSNKIETRKRLKLKNCFQPAFEIARTTAEAEIAAHKIGLPCIIKAPDSSGSRGVVKVTTADEIPSAFQEALKYTRSAFILIEEYVSGLEFGAQTFSVNGKCCSVLIHNDIMSPPPYMIPVGHSFPFKYPEQTTVAIAEIKRAIEALGIADGPANVDLIFDQKKDTIKVIEVGARIGATCLPELVYYHTGIDWVKETIKNAIGEKADLTPKYQKSVAAVIVESPKDGYYKGYRFMNESVHAENILEFEITAKPDEEVNVLRKGTDRIGKIVVSGKNVMEAENTALSFRNAVIIDVK